MRNVLLTAMFALLALGMTDPFLWLEDVTGERALQWVHQQNAATTAQLCSDPNFDSIRKRLLAIYDSPQRIPAAYKQGKYLYNFWRDPQHVRGLYRRTTLDSYVLPNPNWETVVDLDALSAAEKENWVWKEEDVLKPSYDRCLVSLSRGGADAVAVRELDLNTKQFIADGFTLPEAKTNVAWKDADTLYVATDFGPGSQTTSGYPRIVKEWKRGTPLSQATTVFECKPEDVSVGPVVLHDHGVHYEFMDVGTTIFNDRIYVHRGTDWVLVPKPDDAEWQTFGEYLLLRPRSTWNAGGRTYKSGSLLAIKFDAFMNGDRNLSVLFEPGERSTLESFAATKNYVLLNVMENVSSKDQIVELRDGKWMPPLPLEALGAGPYGQTTVEGVDADESDQVFITTQNFLTPPRLLLQIANQPGYAGNPVIKSLPAQFDATGLVVQQHEAVSKDGTRVPYFQIGRKDMKLDGSNVTLLYGYGGFEISLNPYYSAGIGAAWLERGNVFVLANIRGGGEFGPAWHDAAKKEHRQRAYDDFQAIAEDLISRGVTTAKRLGIKGASNGGLLMGVMLTERPDLFGAVCCGSPLLDMKRYSHLLAGASWMDEYGDPDKPEDWAYVSKYSPYQNTSKDRVYPPVLFTTSTRDDRVHPGHARKMAALLEDEGHSVLFYENVEGGHAASANHEQQAYVESLSYVFLMQKLK